MGGVLLEVVDLEIALIGPSEPFGGASQRLTQCAEFE